MASTSQENASETARLTSVAAALDGDIGPDWLNISDITLDHRTTLADTRATTVHTIMEANRGRQRFDEVSGTASRSSLSNSLTSGCAAQICRAATNSLVDFSSQAELRQRARSQLTQSGLGVLRARLEGLDGEGNPAGEARTLQDHLAA